MRSLLLVALLALALCARPSTAYLLNSTLYYGAGDLYPSYQTYNGPTNNNVGKYFFTFDPNANTLQYNIISTLPVVGAVTMNGPSNCGGNGQNSAACINNDAPVLVQLAYGASPTLTGDNAPGNQYFSGTLTLTSIQVLMLFNYELYFEVNSAVQDPNNANNYINVPVLRGHVYPFQQSWNVNGMYSYFSFQQNTGQFNPQTTSATTNKGVGWVYVTPAATTQQAVFNIYTSIKESGTYYLQCDTGTVQIYPPAGQQGQNTLGLNNYPFTFTTAQAPILSEMLIPGKCFVFITSTDFPNGDLFSYLTPISTYTSIAQGKSEATPVASAAFAISFITFDYGTKSFQIVTQTNLTVSTITGVQMVSNSDSRVVCAATFNPTGTPATTFAYNWVNNPCVLNYTDVINLQNGDLYLNFQTTNNPTGEIRGAVLSSSYSAGPNTLAIGLGVGLGVGIPVAAAAGVGIFFLAKHVSGSVKSSGKI